MEFFETGEIFFIFSVCEIPRSSESLKVFSLTHDRKMFVNNRFELTNAKGEGKDKVLLDNDLRLLFAKADSVAQSS